MSLKITSQTNRNNTWVKYFQSVIYLVTKKQHSMTEITKTDKISEAKMSIA